MDQSHQTIICTVHLFQVIMDIFKVTNSSDEQSSSVVANEGSVELCAEPGKEKVLKAFTKLDPLSVTVAVTFLVKP